MMVNSHVQRFWKHACAAERQIVCTAEGEPCSWCGCTKTGR